jgi:hypothetical protein
MGWCPPREREACEKSVSCECGGIMTQHVRSSNQKIRLTRFFSPSPSKVPPFEGAHELVLTQGQGQRDTADQLVPSANRLLELFQTLADKLRGRGFCQNRDWGAKALRRESPRSKSFDLGRSSYKLTIDERLRLSFPGFFDSRRFC